MNEELLELLLSEISVSGEERQLQDKLTAYMEDVAENIQKDDIGNGVYSINGGGNRKILLAAHIDEIGLMITGATEDGYLKVTNVGGIHPEVYPGNSVRIRTGKGIIYGVATIKAAGSTKEKIAVKDLFIDIGASSKEEALEIVTPGNIVIPDSDMHKLAGDRITARGLDDRSGVYVIMETLRKIAAEGTPNTVLAAATVGEEIGKHGASWVAARTCPDEAIVVDVTYTSDCPGMEQAEWGEIKLGQGPAIGINPICDKGMVQKLLDIAKSEGIPYQYEVSGGRSCTDADEIHIAGKGIPVVLVSIPLRYMHSPAEVVDLRDLENTVKLLLKYLSAK